MNFIGSKTCGCSPGREKMTLPPQMPCFRLLRPSYPGLCQILVYYFCEVVWMSNTHRVFDPVFSSWGPELTIWSKRTVQGHVCWHIFKIKVINVLYIQQVSMSGPEETSQQWLKLFELRGEIVTAFRSQGHFSDPKASFVVPTIGLSLHPPVLPFKFIKWPGSLACSCSLYPLVYHVFEWFPKVHVASVPKLWFLVYF